MNIVLFGCGNCGTIAYEYFKSASEGDNVVAFADNNCSGSYKNLPIYSIHEMCNIRFDYIYICIANKIAMSEVKKQLVEVGIPQNKIRGFQELPSLNRYVAEHYVQKSDVDYRVNWLRTYAAYVHDQNIEGGVAECGVYKGDFAKYINQYFADKSCYLFDTFEGFDQRDYTDGVKQVFDKTFLNTSMEEVLSKLPYQDKVIIRKGYFPDTAKGLGEQEFCFVNLDMDLFQPQYEGLKFFYPRMVPGGVILMHDYFNVAFPGTTLAIEQYEREQGFKLVKFPIGDDISIAIIKC